MTILILVEEITSMKIVNRSRTGRVIKVLYEINSVNELEEFVKNSPLKLKKKIKDFIKFSNNDIPYLDNLIKTTEHLSHSELMWECLSKNIFHYHHKSQREYWLCRGWTDEDTTKKVSECQSIAGKASSKIRLKNPNFRMSLPNCKEYWIKKGFSEEESIEKVKERQSTFTLEKCIKKYGKELGQRRFDNRQSKWINSLYSNKTDEEIIAFEKSKMIDFCKASKSSLKVFLPLISYLKEHNIITNDNQYHLGYEDKKEYFLYNKENQILFFYDFTIPNLKIIIEFNGHVWHSTGDSWKPLSHVSQSKEQILNKEKLKEETVSQNGFRLLKIWDTDSSEINLKKCIEFITKNNSLTIGNFTNNP